MDTTARLGMPLLSAGQAQKEVVHNEALHIVDALLAGAVEEPPRNAPPASPIPGQCYIVGPQPTAEWEPYVNHVTAFTAGGWRYFPPRPGMSLHVRSAGVLATFADGRWVIGEVRGDRLVIAGKQVVGPQLTAIAAPSGGSSVDVEGRSTIEAILVALRAHGLIKA